MTERDPRVPASVWLILSALCATLVLSACGGDSDTDDIESPEGVVAELLVAFEEQDAESICRHYAEELQERTIADARAEADNPDERALADEGDCEGVVDAGFADAVLPDFGAMEVTDSQTSGERAKVTAENPGAPPGEPNRSMVFDLIRTDSTWQVEQFLFRPPR